MAESVGLETRLTAPPHNADAVPAYQTLPSAKANRLLGRWATEPVRSRDSLVTTGEEAGLLWGRAVLRVSWHSLNQEVEVLCTRVCRRVGHFKREHTAGCVGKVLGQRSGD